MGGAGASVLSSHPLLTEVVLDRRPEELHFQAELRASSISLLRDHRIYDVPVFPAAAYLDVALAAAEQLTGRRGTAVTNVVFHDPLALPESEARRFRIRVSRTGPETTFFIAESASLSESDTSTWRHHAEGTVEHQPHDANAFSLPRSDVGLLEDPSSERWSGDEFYARADRGPFQWGTTHRVVQWVRRSGVGAVFELRLTDDAAASSGENRLDPTLLDGCLQPPAMEFLGDNSDCVWVPSRIDRFSFRPNSPRTVSVHWRRSHAKPDRTDAADVDLSVFDESGDAIACFEGIRFRSIRREVFLNVMAVRRSEPDARRTKRQDSASSSCAPSTELLRRLHSATAAQRFTLLRTFIEENVVELVKLKNPTAADLQRGFFSIGLDSLLAIELQFRLQKALDFSLPPSVGLTFETVEGLTRHLLEEVLSIGGTVGAGTP